MTSTEWRNLKLKDIAQLKKESYKPTKAETIPYIGLEHIEQQTLHLSGFGNSSDVISQKNKFSKGDILFGKLRPYFRKVYKAKFDGVSSTDILIIEPKSSVDSDFLFYLIANKAFIDLATNGSSGTKMPRADWTHLSNSRWNIPDVKSQQKIGKILSALDEKIELNRQTNATLEAIAQAIFKEWFVNFNYPGATGEMVESELGHDSKTGWKIPPNG